jgi:hypothetical protein
VAIRKDLAWNRLIKGMWIGFVIPTMLLAFDFAVTSATYKGMMVEHLHYVTYFLWLMVCIIPVIIR